MSVRFTLSSGFEFSRRLDREQTRWAAVAGHGRLLAGLGVSLCERAVLDALCRSLDRPLHQLLQGADRRVVFLQ